MNTRGISAFEFKLYLFLASMLTSLAIIFGSSAWLYIFPALIVALAIFGRILTVRKGLDK